jgi:hypothetical protein
MFGFSSSDFIPRQNQVVGFLNETAARHRIDRAQNCLPGIVHNLCTDTIFLFPQSIIFWGKPLGGPGIRHAGHFEMAPVNDTLAGTRIDFVKK